MRTLTDYTFSYDGAPMDESRGPFNPCPECGSNMSMVFDQFGLGKAMICEDCSLYCDFATEQVWRTT